MCPACARPQPVAPTCAHCGAALPEAPHPPGPPVPSSAAVPPASEVEVPLGGATRLFVGEDALELHGGDGSRERLALMDVRRVILERQRPWLPLAVVAIVLALALALSGGWLLRAVLLVVAGAAALFVLRREVLFLRIDRVNATPRRIRLGHGGSTGSATGVAASSRWAELSEELRRRGVDVQD